MANSESTYASGLLLKIEGKAASDDLLEDILHVSVDESLSRAGAFMLVIKNSKYSGTDNDAMWKHEDVFKIGHSIKVGFQPNATDSDDSLTVDDANYLISGEITGMETHFTEGSQAPIIIRGYDTSHRLHRGRHNRSFQNMTDSDIVKKIAGEVGISTGVIDNSGAPHDYVFQENQTNMAFLRDRAFRNGFELFVQDNKLFFRRPKKDEVLELAWLKTLSSFQVRVTSAEQVEQVEVRGWDYKTKQPIIATKSKSRLLTKNEYGEGRKQSKVFDEKPGEAKLIVVDQPIFTPKEAEAIAQGLFDEFSGEFVQADAKAEGNPKIRPGTVVKLKEMGKYSGDYYVTETRQVISERYYQTEFAVRGLRGGDLLSTLRPKPSLQPGQTLLVGKVTNNNDPDGLGRVRVKFPTLTEDHESNWARVVTLGAGPDRGFDCLPEVDDEVLVGFEHGNIHRPYIMGNVWNGKDSPPAPVKDSVTDNKVRLRTLKTRTGHQLQFVEEDKGSSKKGIYLDSVYGHHIYLNDSEQLIEVKTKGGQTIRMEDQGSKIEIKSTGSISMEAPQKITLKVGGSTLEMSPAAIDASSTKVAVKGNAAVDINGGASVKIQGGIVKIN